MSITNTLFEEFYAANYNKAVRYARSIVFDQDVAKEITCHAMQLIWSLRSEVDHQKRMNSILILTIREACIQYLKNNSEENHVEMVSDIVRNTQDLPSCLSQDLINYVNLLMSSLHSHTYDCFSKVRLEGKKFEAVAEEMLISSGYVEDELRRTSWEMHQLLRTYNEYQV